MSDKPRAALYVRSAQAPPAIAIDYHLAELRAFARSAVGLSPPSIRISERLASPGTSCSIKSGRHSNPSRRLSCAMSRASLARNPRWRLSRKRSTSTASSWPSFMPASLTFRGVARASCLGRAEYNLIATPRPSSARHRTAARLPRARPRP